MLLWWCSYVFFFHKSFAQNSDNKKESHHGIFFCYPNNFLVQEMNQNTYHFIAFADRHIKKMVCNYVSLKEEEEFCKILYHKFSIPRLAFRSALNINKSISIIHNHTRPEKIIWAYSLLLCELIRINRLSRENLPFLSLFKYEFLFIIEKIEKEWRKMKKNDRY